MAWDGNGAGIFRPQSCSLELKRLVKLKIEWDLTTPTVKQANLHAQQFNDDCVRVLAGTQPVFVPIETIARPRRRVRFVPHGHPMRPGFVVEGYIKAKVGRGFDLRDHNGRPYYAHFDDIVGYYNGDEYHVLRGFEDGASIKVTFRFDIPDDQE